MNKTTREVVLFRFRNATAKAVIIAGIVGDWHPSFTSMEKYGKGVWQKYLHMSPGEHKYRLIVDGKWDAIGIRTVTVPKTGEAAVNPAERRGLFVGKETS